MGSMAKNLGKFEGDPSKSTSDPTTDPTSEGWPTSPVDRPRPNARESQA